MSEIPPPAPADDQPHSASPARAGFSEYVSWGIILLITCLIIGRNLQRDAQQAPTMSSPTVDVQLEVAAKSAVGTEALLPRPAGSTQPTTSSTATIAPLLQQIDALARTPRQQLHAAVVAGEVNGPDAAIRRLDAIEAAPAPAELERDLAVVRRIYSSGPESLDPSSRQRMLDQHGFFGRLALSYGLPASDPLRAQVLHEGNRMVVISVVAGAGGLGVLFLGLLLFITAIVLIAVGVLRRNYGPQPGGPSVYVEMFAVYLLSYAGISLILSLVLGGPPPLEMAWVISLVLPITLAWGILRGVKWSELRRAIGWHGGRGWYIEIPLGVAGYFAFLPILGLGLLVTYMLIKLSGATPSHPIITEAANHSPLRILMLYGIASIWAPVIEETMFRGILFHHLRRRWGWFISALVVAIFFAAIHPQGWTTIPALATIAMILAALREWRGSILAPMAAHAFHNGILVTMLILMT